MTTLPPDGIIADFPQKILPAASVFQRAHSIDNNPVFFSAKGTGRFDPPKRLRHEYGTCHMAYEDTGAFLERFGDFKILTERDMATSAISELALVRQVKVADLTNRVIVGQYRIDLSLSAGSPHERALTQEWGAAFRRAGFDGVHYTARHDVTCMQKCLAIFGAPGEQSPHIPPPTLRRDKNGDPQSISAELIDRMERMFGFLVLPTSEII